MARIGKNGICSGCGEERWLTKPSLMLCAICNKNRLDEGKEYKKPTGEKAMFDEIWKERDHKSFLSGYNLDAHVGQNTWYNLFAHVLAKGQGKYPKFKLNKENIVLLTPHEHLLFDHGDADQRKKYADKIGCDWGELFRLKEKLRDEYKTIG